MGRATFNGVTCEIRSANHKYLEITQKLPPELEEYAEDFKGIIRRYCKRGFISSSIKIEDRYLPLSLNRQRLKKYISLLNLLEKDFPVKKEIKLSDIFSLPNLIGLEPKGRQKIISSARQALKMALQRLLQMRKEEGENLHKDFAFRLRRIIYSLQAIKDRLSQRLEKKRSALKRRLQKTFTTLPENKIEEELSLLAQRLDVSEELTRLRSHCRLLSSSLKRESAGRRLEFILLEMLRETETLLAKCRDFPIAKKIIIIKEEIEKMREQARNVE